MADIRNSNPFGTQQALGIQQAAGMGRPITPQFASQVSQAVTPTVGQEMQQAFQQYEASRQKEDAMRRAQAQTASMKEMIGRQKQSFETGQSAERKLAAIDSRAKNELLDMQLEFRRDAAGQKYMTERQLVDWAVTKSRGEEDYKNFAQNMQNTYDKKIQLMTAVYKRLSALEKQTYQKDKLERQQTLQMDVAGMNRESQQKLTQMGNDLKGELAETERAGRERITRAKIAAQEKIAKLEIKAKNAQALMGALAQVGSVAGAVAGTAIGGPVGAAVGATAGGVLATAIGKWGAESGGKFTF